MNAKKFTELFNSNFAEITEIKEIYDLDKLAYIDANLTSVNLKQLKIMLKKARISIIYIYKELMEKQYLIGGSTTDSMFIRIIKQKCEKILIDRNSQYSSNTDRLHNFKVGAQLLGIKTYQFALSLMTKQWISLMDFQNGKEYSIVLLEEKIIDTINYLILIEACFIDEHGSK